jgi:DNA-binding NtrC family response regulator/pSer/pThr/pTyr-binding forkhead associated (FHA) protein
MENARILLKGNKSGKDVVFSLSGRENVIGRDLAAEITVPDARVSRRHAIVSSESDRFFLVDLESSNGTFLNGAKCRKSPLTDGDEIRVGNSTLVFHTVREDAAAKDVVLSSEPLSTIVFSDRFDPERSIRAIRDQAATKGSAYLEFLYRSVNSLNLPRPPGETFEAVLDGLLDTIGAQRAALIVAASVGDITSEDCGETRLQGMGGHFAARDEDRILRTPFSLAMDVVNHVLGAGKGVVVENADAHGGMRSAVCVPLVIEGRVGGLLYADSPSSAVVLREAELHLAGALASSLAGFMERRARMEAVENRCTALVQAMKTEHSLVGNGKAITAVFDFISKASSVDSSVLITGESGTGKELVTRAIHFSGNRKDGPFVVVNCGALPETLLESELFGHEKGAFTGAASRKPGKFELADKGTIFLDEIGEMSPSAQARLLRVAEHGSFERVGGTESLKVDVRLIAATNCPLKDAIAAGRFREDLLYRLNVLAVHLPPLRERREDIPQIARYLLENFRRNGKAAVRDFSPGALEKMAAYYWPGNVRELRNAVERAAIMCEGPVIEANDLPLEVGALTQGGNDDRIMALNDLERRQIEKALKMTAGNKSKAAAMLGIDRTTLYDKLRKYGLQGTGDAK